TPIVNIVGDHATYHLQHDAPLTSDIEGLARPVSRWVRTSPNAAAVGGDAAEAIAAAMAPPGGIATLILPADTAWTEGGIVAAAPTLRARAPVAAAKIEEAARWLKSEGAMLLIGGVALRQHGLDLAGAIAKRTGCRIMAPGSNARVERGAGRVSVDRVP